MDRKPKTAEERRDHAQAVIKHNRKRQEFLAHARTCPACQFKRGHGPDPREMLKAILGGMFGDMKVELHELTPDSLRELHQEPGDHKIH